MRVVLALAGTSVRAENGRGALDEHRICILCARIPG